MVSDKRGSFLIAALLILAILLSLGIGLMSGQAGKLSAAQARANASQAKALARAGLEDARVKLGKDILYPPPHDEQEFFSYSEDVFTTAGDFLGTYTVVIDLRYEVANKDLPPPNEDIILYEGVYIVTSIGKVGDRAVAPLAERTLYGEIDIDTFIWIRIEDKGGL